MCVHGATEHGWSQYTQYKTCIVLVQSEWPWRVKVNIIPTVWNDECVSCPYSHFPLSPASSLFLRSHFRLMLTFSFEDLKQTEKNSYYYCTSHVCKSRVSPLQCKQHPIHVFNTMSVVLAVWSPFMDTHTHTQTTNTQKSISNNNNK